MITLQRALGRFAVSLALLMPSIAMGQTGNTGLPTPCRTSTVDSLQTNLGVSRTDPSYVNPLNGAIFDSVPDVAVGYFQRLHSPIASVFLQIPMNDVDYKHVFDTELVSQSDQVQMLAAQKVLASSGAETGSFRSHRDFVQLLKTTSSDYIILVGHNDQGHFAFFEGPPILISLLERDCAESKKVCIFVSCNSSDYLTDGSNGVKRNLTLPEGVFIATQLQEMILSKHTPISQLQIAAFIRNIDNTANIKYHISYMALAGCGAMAATGVVAVIVVEGAD